MKYFGIALLAMLSIAVGRVFSMRSINRIYQLESIVLMIEKIKTHLTFCNSSVEEIMEVFAHEDKKMFSFFKKSLELYKGGKSFSEAWGEGIESEKNILCIKKDETELLLSLGKRLGTTDLKGQIGICELYTALFEERLKDARENEKKRSKLYSKLGYIGAALIITLLF